MHVIRTGKTIEEYPDDHPYPSRLVLGWCEKNPLHIVLADNMEEHTIIIITVYEPDPDLWEKGFERRKEV